MKVKDFAKLFGHFMDSGENDYRVTFNCNDNESFVVDSLADIGHSSNVVSFRLEKDNGHNGMKVKDLFKVFNDIKCTESICFDYGKFDVDLKHSYYDGTDAYWGLCVDVYNTALTNLNICFTDKVITFSIELA